jgi:hypothetical protein
MSTKITIVINESLDKEQTDELVGEISSTLEYQGKKDFTIDTEEE